MASDDFACIYFVTASVSSAVSPSFYSKRQRKMAARCFLQVYRLAKVVFLRTCLLNSVQYERTFLNSVQYENLLNVYFLCKLKGAITWWCWCFELETGPRLRVSSERLEERRIEPATLGLQGQRANHCATAAPVISWVYDKLLKLAE